VYSGLLQIFLLEHWVQSLKAFVACCLLYTVGSFATTATWLYLTIFAMFAIPPVYKRNSSLITRETGALSNLAKGHFEIATLEVRKWYIQLRNFFNKKLRSAIDANVASAAAKVNVTKQRMKDYISEHEE
jgi:hypothetical protein